MHKALTVFAVTTLLASSASAAGFMVSEHTAESAGQAGAISSRIDNASSVFYNTAGLTRAKGTQFFLSASAILGAGSATSTQDGAETVVESEHPMGILPALFASYQLDDSYTLGMGVFNPFGSSLAWPATTTDGTTSNPQRGLIRELSLKTPTLALAGAVNLDSVWEGLSVGAAFDVTMASVYFARDLVFGQDIAELALGGQTVGLGGRLGVQYNSPDTDGATFGMTFRLPVKLDIEGKMDIDQVGADTSSIDYRSALPADGDISGSITLPMGAEFCVGSQWSENLHLGVAMSYTHWESYEELAFVLPDGSTNASPKNWHNTITVRVGAEYDFGGVLGRAGYMNDMSPIPEETLDTTLTGMTRHYVTAGAGMGMGDMDVHLSVLYKLPVGSRSAGTRYTYEPVHKADYTLDIFMATLSVSYRADAGEEAAE